MALSQETKSDVIENSLEWERSRLDKEQLEAVETTEGYVRVVAGAGSGKTRTLTHRYLYLVKEMGISPANILCVTFTNKAAAEMKKRIRSILGGDDSGYISTFHGFCVFTRMGDIWITMASMYAWFNVSGVIISFGA